MAITKEVVAEKVESVGKWGVINVREKITYKEDGKITGSVMQRRILVPGDSLDKEPDNVKAICNAVWTDKVVSTYAAIHPLKTTNIDKDTRGKGGAQPDSIVGSNVAFYENDS